MTAVPLIMTLLIIAAVLAQAVSFFVTYRIRRKLYEDEREDNVIDFTGYKNRFDEKKIPLKTKARKPFVK